MFLLNYFYILIKNQIICYNIFINLIIFIIYMSLEISSLNQLKTFAEELEQEGLYLEKKLKKKSPITVSSQLKIDTLATAYLEKHQRLKESLLEILFHSEKQRIPKEALRAYEFSTKVLQAAQKKTACLANFTQETLYSDPHRLTSHFAVGSKSCSDFSLEWEVNFSLLYSAYEEASDEATQHLIRFLMINYLSKAAFFNTGPGMLLNPDYMHKYTSSLQIGQLPFQGSYHRGALEILPILKLLSKIGYDTDRATDILPLETTEIQDLYPLGFVSTPDISQIEDVADIFVQEFIKHSSDEQTWEKPLLIDITNHIFSVLTHGRSDRIDMLKQEELKAKKQFFNILDLAASKIYQLNPSISCAFIKERLFSNCAIVSRTQLSPELSIFYTHSSFFSPEDFDAIDSKNLLRERKIFLSDTIHSWLSQTGLRVGAVQFRKILANTYRSPEELSILGNCRASKYVVSGAKGIIHYLKPTSLLETSSFASLAILADSDSSSAQQLYARATVTLLRQLLASISQESWDEKQQNPAILELTQTSCFRIAQTLAEAHLFQHDFRKFSQAIDRLHGQMTTLLAIYTPFDPKDFERAYATYIQEHFPSELTPSYLGIAKAAMNVFAGVNAAVFKMQPNPTRIAMDHSYYEESALLGTSCKSLDQVLTDSSVKKVDLYVAEFNHNIDIDPLHSHYAKGSVIQDIQRIFTEKPGTDSLTVAIDSTLDYTRSSDVQLLLKTFKQEIQEGKLNVVIFRSGQKFDMLGLDNYFGSPFYVINNNDEKWKHFKDIKTAKAYQTDPLSIQFFTWLNLTDPSLVDSYKDKIFQNTKDILSLVPSSFLPQEGKKVFISTVSENVNSSFIEIALTGEDSFEQIQWIQQLFFEIFTEANKLVYARGSFGFAHPNFTWIDPKIRINPGIDSSDNPLFLKFFKALEQRLQES